MFDDKAIEAAQTRMETARSGFDGMRGELASMLLPHRAEYSVRSIGQDQPRTETPFDEYAALAMADGVAAFEGLTMPRGQKWQGVQIGDEALMDDLSVQQWFERVAIRIFRMRNDPESGFTSAVHEGVENLYAMGEQSLWIDKRFDDRGRFKGISYQAESIDGVFVENDAEGRPMRIHRRFRLSAEAARRKFKGDTPKKVREAAESQTTQATSFEFLHVIERNPAVNGDRIDFAAMPWRACYYSVADKGHFLPGGYRVLRRIVSRWNKSSEQQYGTGPSRLVLGAIRAAQVIQQDRVLGVEQTVKPPMVAEDDELDRQIIDLGPYGITYGGMSQGRPTIAPLFPSIDLSQAKDLHGEVRMVIDYAFQRHLMQINREQKTHISAARTIEEIAEKGVLLSPLARQEGELFAPMLNAELDILWDEGLLDDMPAILFPWFRAGGGVQATYDNRLTQMMMANDAAGYFRMAEQIGAIAQFEPGAIQMFTREYPLTKVVPALGRVNGVPPSWRASDEEKAAADEAAAQAQAQQQLLEALPALSAAGKNIAEMGGGANVQ
ncbi:portal protein [Sphingomonas hankookensis]|uniref:portal protein n=1 Tax=Sphingomonas hankookensis TaxID=563996 RepID=UPI001F58A2BC|nr:portal protein [Sphingomonas hankookensis]